MRDAEKMILAGRVAILCGDLHLDQFVALQHFAQLRDEGRGHTLAAGLQQGLQVVGLAAQETGLGGGQGDGHAGKHG